MKTVPNIPREVRRAVNAIVDYMAYDEIRSLSDYGRRDKSDDNISDVQGHIAQSVITLAKWAGGDARNTVAEFLEMCGVVNLPGGWWMPGEWVSSNIDDPKTESRGGETAAT